VKQLLLDGQPLEGNVVPIDKLKDGMKIEAVIS
jgi:hypothetical protein